MPCSFGGSHSRGTLRFCSLGCNQVSEHEALIISVLHGMRDVRKSASAILPGPVSVPATWFRTIPAALSASHQCDLELTQCLSGFSPSRNAVGSTGPASGQNTEICRFTTGVIAWKDCAQARRSVHEALPFLRRREALTDLVQLVGQFIAKPGVCQGDQSICSLAH